jgi:hypothetical protein
MVTQHPSEMPQALCLCVSRCVASAHRLEKSALYRCLLFSAAQPKHQSLPALRLLAKNRHRAPTPKLSGNQTA